MGPLEAAVPTAKPVFVAPLLQPQSLGGAGPMDPKEQLRQVGAEMAKDEAEAKRLSRTDAAGGNQPLTGSWIWGRHSGGSSNSGCPGDPGKRLSKGRVY